MMSLSEAIPDKKALSSQRQLIAALLLWVVMWIVVFFDAISSAVRVWYINDTFNHCFFVLPLVLYSIWSNKGAMAEQPPGISIIGALSILVCLFLYALGKAAYVEFIQHIAVFGMLPATLLFVTGWQVFKKVLAPMAFVFFCVPFGEELVPFFQEITADIALFLLKIIGVPVFRDGLYITIPNGNFVVAEACSGVRFFIACIVLGCAFAYMNFRSQWRAVLFVAYSMAMPVLANGIRAFGIIYIGHTVSIEKASGADHIIFGWVFFAFVILFLVFSGYLFSDGSRQWRETLNHVHEKWKVRSGWGVLCLSLFPIILGGFLNLMINPESGKEFDLDKGQLKVVSEQELSNLAWVPSFKHADQYRVMSYNSSQVNVYQAIYHHNKDGKEMINWKNRLFDVDAWSVIDNLDYKLESVGSVNVKVLTSLNGRKRLLVYWFVVVDRVSSNQWKIKLQQAINSLLLRPSGGALIAFSVDFDGDPQRALVSVEPILSNAAAEIGEYHER